VTQRPQTTACNPRTGTPAAKKSLCRRREPAYKLGARARTLGGVALVACAGAFGAGG